ncbi:MAG: Tudor-knot domain-containing protein [Cyanobacteria bacterium P01_G01_bin.54]
MADGKLDVLAALIDQTTNYYEHTGIQSVARAVILAAQAQIQAEPEPEPLKQMSPNRPATDGAATAEFQVGQTVEVWDEEEEDWFEAKVLEVSNREGYYVHYAGYDAEDDEWVDEEELRSPPAGDLDDWGFAIGQTVKVWDEDEEEWYTATIRQAEAGEYFVHYRGYGSADDEWVDVEEML